MPSETSVRHFHIAHSTPSLFKPKILLKNCLQLLLFSESENIAYAKY